jgi:AP-3 complex subunit beta
VSDDLKGLVLSPVPVSSAGTGTTGDRSGQDDADRDSGAWLQLVRPDLAGGLSVRARYLRGATRTKESLSMGLLVSDATPNVVCLQVRFENDRKAGGAPFRRLKLQQRSSVPASGSSSSSSSVIGPRKVVAPPEIPQLAPGQQVDCVLGIEFSGISDRDGSLLARVDVHFGTGSVPVEIRPTLGDLLQPPTPSVPATADSFDASVRNLQGFQRIESRFEVPAAVVVAAAAGAPLEAAGELVARSVAGRVALTRVAGRGSADVASSGKGADLKLRFVGCLPSAGDPVYVLLTLARGGTSAEAAAGSSGSAGTHRGKAVVCCVQPLAVNSVMNQVKRALQGVSSSQPR